MEQDFIKYICELIARNIGAEPKNIRITTRRHPTSPECELVGDYEAYIPLNYKGNWELGYYKVYLNEEIVASWELWGLAHCCAVCLSCCAHVESTFEKKGLGTLLNWVRMEFARRMGYSLMMCTDIVTNIAQQKVLDNNNWSKVWEVHNSRTGNMVGVHLHNL